MEDGSNGDSRELENNNTTGAADQRVRDKSDKYLSVNGGSNSYERFENIHNSTNKFADNEKSVSKHPKEVLFSKNKVKEQIKPAVKPIPKPLIIKQSTFKPVVKRPGEIPNYPTKLFKENGEFSSHLNVQSTSRDKPIDEDALQKAIIKLHSSANVKTKQKAHQVSCKKRKIEESADCAQYLVLQPALKFKCVKCSGTFPSLVMLKQHQRTCTITTKTLSTCLPTIQKSRNPASADTNLRFTRSVYLCSACGTYYENWNLFLHIREVHNRHTCLFCFGMFSQAQKLASHLVVKHNIQEDLFTSKEDLSSKFSDSFYLLCCKCEKVFTERDEFILHECSQVTKQCSVCKLKGSHSLQCPKNSKVKKLNSTSDGNVKKSASVTSPPKVSSDVTAAASAAHTDVISDPKTLSNVEIPGSKSASINANDSCDKLTTKTIENIENDCNSNETLTTKDFNNLNQFDRHDISKSSEPVSSCSDIDVNSKEDDSICESKSENVQPSIKPVHLNNLDSSPPVPKEDLENNQSLSEDIMETSVAVANDVPAVDDLSYSNHNMSASEPQTPVTTTETLYQIHPSVSWPRKPQFLSKPPPRNRRPPKRYQTSEMQEETPNPTYPLQQTFTPSPSIQAAFHQAPVQEQNSSKVNIAASEPENRLTVPKLTVKIPKTIFEKQSTSDYSSESEDSDKLTVDVEDTSGNSIQENKPLDNIHTGSGNEEENEEETDAMSALEGGDNVNNSVNSSDSDLVVAGEEVAMTELTLENPLDRYTLKQLLLVFLQATAYHCIYCNHARKIAVNAKQLALHFLAEHRFSATVNSITAEELLPDTIVYKVKSSLEEVQSIYINLEGFDTEDKSKMKFYDQTLECFQCFYVTGLQKDLYSHNRKMHQKTILLCVMCKCNFYSYSELLCHLCPGTYMSNSEISFHCCLCPKDAIPSAFRLMVHLRKTHDNCDVCLEFCHNQTRLSNHVWKHKLHHLCYRCGIAYRNKPDITKHLFWKHGTESVLCKKCLQKRWPHVYHFCTPPATFICEECNLTFTKAVSLKVHKRFHSNDIPYACTHEGCQEKFVSKKLLAKHESKHSETREIVEPPPKQTTPIDDKNEIIVIDDEPDDEVDTAEKPEDKSTQKLKKSKKSKKNKDNKDSLLIDVNLPALNLSESDSSDESDLESSKVAENANQVSGEAALATSEPTTTAGLEPRPDAVEETKVENTVPDVWDNFKMYQAQKEKEAVSLLPPKPKHVCDSDHDYCVIPLSDYELLEEQHRLNMEGLSPTKENKKKLKTKKKTPKKGEGSSSSDSSSDSDSSCSCGSNCSCSSSSGSSSSSSSSSDSELDSSPKQVNTVKPHKDSDASAVDVGMPLAEPVELPIAETDLDTDETETDEDFYDEHPQCLANKMLAEKRNKLLLLATVAPVVNNGTYLDSSRPVTPEVVENIPQEPKVKVKNKKKRKRKGKMSPTVPPIKIPLRVEDTPPIIPPNKITISLQTKTVIDKSGIDSPKMMASTPKMVVSTPKMVSTLQTDIDNKRASKRRRVPNKFYGYSSDEEYIQNQKLPPKLEWRKEDLPSSSGFQSQPPVVTDYPNIADIMMPQDSKPVVSPKLIIKDPIYTSSEDDDESDSSREGALQINHPMAEPVEPVITSRLYNQPIPHLYGSGVPFPRPAGAREAKEGESVYCYCRCPYDEVSEMIACDAEGCAIEWFHFECVGIMVPPKGKWFCPDCRQKDEYYNQM